MAPPMKFATKIVALQHREWSDYYLDYNGLKRILAEIDDDDDGDGEESSSALLLQPAADHRRNEPISLLTKESLEDEAATSSRFLTELYSQVQKISLFVLKEQGRIADDLVACRSDQRRLWTEDGEGENGGVCESDDDDGQCGRRFRELRDRYNRLGASLLHLIQFVDLNYQGVSRILKKHDKRVSSAHRAYDLFLPAGGSPGGSGGSPAAIMMAPLYREESLDALCVTLQSAYTDLRLAEEQWLCGDGDGDGARRPVEPAPPSAQLQDPEVQPRGRSMEAVDTAAANKPSPRRRGRSPRGLGRRFRSIQGLQGLVPEGGSGTDGIEHFQKLSQAKSLSGGRGVGEAMVLNEVKKKTAEDDFIMAQIYAARRNINEKDDVWNMLATTSLGFPAAPPDIVMPGQDSRIRAEYERASALAAYKRSSAISHILNYVSSFIYMANYLIVVPTVVTYSNKLGADPALSSAIVGMTPFATIFSTILYSWWTSYSYRVPLTLAAALNVAGNFVYALGYPCNSMAFVLLGRLMSGMGSCRPINRRYIADAYSTADRTAASAHFVAVGSFGMALGPFLGSVLHRVADGSTSPYWQVENAPGWFMCGVWAVYLVFHVLFFVDPPREDKMEPVKASSDKAAAAAEDRGGGGSGEEKPLLADERSASSDEINSVPIWKNAAVLVNFFIYFIEKLLMECVSSSTSILTYYYFGWPGSWAGYWLAFLCLLVLPVNLLVAYLSKMYSDRAMMAVMQAATVLGCLVILRYDQKYHEEQYLLGSLFIVVFSNMVEGPNMSLLSKTIPKSWRRGFLNVGLLATEAATMGRTAGDAFLALCGTGGLDSQLNYTFGSMTIATAFTLYITWHFYDSLVPTEDRTL